MIDIWASKSLVPNVQYERRGPWLRQFLGAENTLSKAAWWRKGIGRHAPHLCVNLCTVKCYMYERMSRRKIFLLLNFN